MRLKKTQKLPLAISERRKRLQEKCCAFKCQVRHIYIGGKSDSMKEGIALAAEIIDSGKALETLNKLIEVSNRSEV